MAKGDVVKVVNDPISANSANIPLSIQTAMAIDLAGRDVLNAVTVSVNPKVISTPMISAIAKDGIELRSKAMVTAQRQYRKAYRRRRRRDDYRPRRRRHSYLDRQRHPSHKDVIENPDRISKTVLAKGLIRARRSRYSLLISPMSMSAEMWAHSSRWDQGRGGQEDSPGKAPEEKGLWPLPKSRK